MEDLYRAAWLGDASKLEELLQQNPTILADIPDDDHQTPLHISSLLGHLPFMEVLLNRNPDLAIREDSSGRTALHLASAEGHMDIVKALLPANNEGCLKGDEEGRIPLHYAAMRGRKEVVQELIMANLDSLSVGDGEGSSVFHLCVIHNQFETLQTLLKLDYATANITGGGQPHRPLIFTVPDLAGNSILHLAIMLKRFEVVSYLLSFPEIRKIRSRKNKKGLTAHHILREKTTSQDDFNFYEIQHMLTDHPQPSLAPLTPIDVVLAHQNDDDRRRNMKLSKRLGNFLMKALIWIESLLRSGDEVWLEEMRGNLSLVATVIATIAFQALINPPGGFIQQGLVSSKDNTTSSSSSNELLLNCSILLDNKTYCPGEALASYDDSNYNNEFLNYLFTVTVSFLASISVSLLLVSGVLPLKNKIVMWVLSMAMWLALTSLARAYIYAAVIITPKQLFDDDLLNVPVIWLDVWNGLLNTIITLVSLRFFIWAIKIFNNKMIAAVLNKSRTRSWWGRHTTLLYIIFFVMFSSFVSFFMYYVIVFLHPSLVLFRLTY